MGSKFVEGRSVEFSKSYEESSPSTPIFFILSPGVDPLKDVEALGKCGRQEAKPRVQTTERDPSNPAEGQVPDTQQGPLPGSCALLVGPQVGGKTGGGPSLSHTENHRTAQHSHSRGHSQTHISQGPALSAAKRQIWPTGPSADEWLILTR